MDFSMDAMLICLGLEAKKLLASVFNVRRLKI
jgi:hypothetical protein